MPGLPQPQSEGRLKKRESKKKAGGEIASSWENPAEIRGRESE
jgi:hypothetical protein